MQQISSQELKSLIDTGQPPVILDIREYWEYEICHLPQSVHISMTSLQHRLNELNRDDEIVVLCHHGARSMQVAHFLESIGFNYISNLTGGIHDWASEIDPNMIQY